MILSASAVQCLAKAPRSMEAETMVTFKQVIIGLKQTGFSYLYVLT